MPKSKQKKFSQINSFSNVLQPGYRFPVYDHPIKRNWNSTIFYTSQPIVLEIGCGKGEYTIGLGQSYPQNNFVGIDIKGNRLWTGAKYALETGMVNVAFLRIQAEHLHCFFDKNEVSGIWITFPDPQTNKPRERKRLTSPRFLDIYRGMLKPGAPIFLKTDNKGFFDYTLDVIAQHDLKLHQATEDLYENPGDTDPAILSIQTYYEKKFLEKGQEIYFLQFSFE